jgi:hypothetical protein
MNEHKQEYIYDSIAMNGMNNVTYKTQQLKDSVLDIHLKGLSFCINAMYSKTPQCERDNLIKSMAEWLSEDSLPQAGSAIHVCFVLFVNVILFPFPF